MTSKNSFLASIKENSKRRIWLYVVSILLWVFVNPVLLAFILNNERERCKSLQMPADQFREMMMRTTLEWTSINSGFLVIVVGMAIVCAIQGFSYLNNKRKVDLYYSVPVSQPKRFAVIYINSVMIFFVPYLGSVLLKLLVALSYGTLNTQVLGAALIEMLIYLVLYLSTYSFVLIPVMLTGSLVITLLATGVFFFFELLSREIVAWYQSTFFSYYSYGSVKTLPLFHPLGQFNKLIISMDGKSSQLAGAEMMILGTMLLLWLVFTVIAYVCFRKRPAEAAGNPMVFRKSKPVVKIILSVITTMLIGAMFNDMSTMGGSISSYLFLLFFMVIGLLLSSCTMEVIYEMDIKAALRKKRHILIAGGCSLLLYLSFAFDWYGFDAWKPSPDQLESATVRVFQLASDGEYYGYYRVNEPEKVLPITDVETICALSEAKYEWGNKEQEILTGSDLNIVYQMKNGKEIHRRFAVTKEGEAVLNKLFLNEQFQRNNFKIFHDEIFETMKRNMTVTFDRGIAVEQLQTEDVDVIRTLLVQDIKKTDYTTLTEQKLYGSLIFTSKNEYDQYREYRYEVYGSYKNTIAYLESQDIYVEYYVNPEDIDSITVKNYNRAQFEGELTGYNDEAFAVDELEVSKTYTEPSQIAELTKALYPYDFAIPFREGYVDNDYLVIVTLKSDAISSATRNGDDTFYILTDQVPGFVKEDTVKLETQK